jgi:hypothetical protein
MAFDFPNAPAAGDEFDSGDAIYVFNAGAWDLKSAGTADMVLKAGDTMTGPLRVQTDPTTNYAILSGGGSAAQGALLEFYNVDATRKAFLGWGISTELILSLESAASLNVKGGNIYMQDGNGIHWGSNSAVTSVNDFSKGICLYGYGGTSEFGFCITGGTLNISVEQAANKIDMNIGGAWRFRVNTNGPSTPLKYQCTDTRDGWNGYFIGDNWHGMAFNGSNRLQFIEFHSNWEWVHRTTGTTGGTVKMSLLGSNLWVAGDVAGASWTYTAVLSRLEADPDLKRFIRGEGDSRGGDMGEMLMYALSEIKALKAEVAALKKRK